MLMPDSPFALLMMGDIAALNKQYPEALASYDSIPQGAPLYWLSRMRVAEVYEASDHMDMAVGLLTDLSKYKPTRLNALVSLGDLYRRHEDFAHALAAYDSALADIGTLTEEHWPVIYARGMALERLNNWTRAEKDLLQALSFQPDNPMILNFIGYSWVDKGVHLDKAMDFIRKAVLLRPDDGYILDSYGWAFFRTGRYADAVKWIEQAVQRVPDDPTILDHLGDAYWQVGRHNEARFKWNRANEISQDGAFKTVIQEKLRKGLATVPQLHAVQKEANL
jgi:tetratricopeptide (TPR) repeat protein